MTSTTVITVIVIVLVSTVVLHIVQAQQPTATATTNTLINNCCDLGFRQSTFSDIVNKPKQYKIKNLCGNHHSTITNVYCDTVTAGGGWLVIQRRIDGSVDFNRYWSEYEEGFGNLPTDDKDTTGEFWIGLHTLHCLTSEGQWELRIDYMLTNKTKGYLSYRHFRVGPASDDYLLSISGFSGNTTDPFLVQNNYQNLNGMRFTTRDRDNDKWSLNCAVDNVGNAGGWWYNGCTYFYLNHQYNYRYGVILNGVWHHLPFVEAKIRPVNCKY